MADGESQKNTRSVLTGEETVRHRIIGCHRRDWQLVCMSLFFTAMGIFVAQSFDISDGVSADASLHGTFYHGT